MYLTQDARFPKIGSLSNSQSGYDLYIFGVNDIVLRLNVLSSCVVAKKIRDVCSKQRLYKLNL